MSAHSRVGWEHHIEQVIRSQHYTWLGEGLGGAPLCEALTDMLADMMHICGRQGISWEQLVARSRKQFEQEDAAAAREFVQVHAGDSAV